MNQLESDVYKTIREYNMLRPGDNVLIGLSGGADSVCLLEILRRLRNAGKLSADLSAVHVHHGLRESADGDEQFVRSFCEERGIPLRVFHIDAAAEAARRGMSVEEAGRTLRREIYAGTAAGIGPGTRVALAHHSEDSAETLLFNLCRGSSLAGLSGILPVSALEVPQAGGGPATEIIRPLIRSSRGEIEEWLTANGVSWRTDETNEDTAYTRNYLRRRIFPELEEQVNAASAAHMARTALELSEAEDFLQEETLRTAAACSQPGPQGETAYLVPKLAGLPPFMQKRTLHLILTQAAGGGRDIGSVHVSMLQELLRTEGSASADLPCGLIARKEYDLLVFCREDEAGEAAAQQRAYPDCPVRHVVQPLPSAESRDCRAQQAQEDRLESAPAAGWPLSAQEYVIRILPYTGEAVPAGRYTKWFDYDKMSQPLQLRTRREGDRIAIGISSCEENDGGRDDRGRVQYKKLTRVMIDRKVPARLRERIVLPMDGEEVLWFPGWRISARHPVDAGTRQVLEISRKIPGGCREGGADADPL